MLILIALLTLFIPTIAQAETLESSSCACACDGTYAVTGELTLTAKNGGVQDPTLHEDGGIQDLSLYEEEVKPVLVTPGTLIINEFMPNPPTGTKEWVEIKNTSNETLVLDGLVLEDGADHAQVLEGELAAGESQIFELTSSILNNDGDVLILKNSDGSVLDSVAYGDVENATLPKPKKGEALTTHQSLPESPSPQTAPESPVSQPQAAPEPVAPEPVALGTLLLSELYPIPNQGEDEWVELENPEDTTLDLAGWSLVDESGKITNLAGEVAGHGFFLVPKPKGKLNNSGDTITLLNPAGLQIDSAEYAAGDGLERGNAWARTVSGWQNTLTPTPGLANVITLPDPVEEETENRKPKTEKSDTVYEVTLLEAHELDKGTLVRTRGIVAVPPGILGKRTFYVAGSGMQVYVHGIDVPQLNLGDEIEIMGKIGSSGGEKRIVASQPDSIRVLGNAPAPAPEPVTLDTIDDIIEGWLVAVEGVVVEKLTDRFILEDANGTIPVVVKTNTQIDQGVLSIGDKVKITGLVSETQSGFRLLPRSPEDIEILETAAPPPEELVRHYSLFTPLAAGFMSAVSLVLTHRTIRARKKQKEKQKKSQNQKGGEKIC